MVEERWDGAARHNVKLERRAELARSDSAPQARATSTHFLLSARGRNCAV